MRIFIDIGHPAHVHYFKNFIWQMQKKHHEFLITARKRGPIFDLLDHYSFDFIDRGKGSTNLFGKIIYIPKADFTIYKIAKKFKPDLLLSFGSIYAAHASRLIGKPHITFIDTEFSRLVFISYIPFTDIICTPSHFRKELGKKHIKFKGFMELCYLHPNYYRPNPYVLNELGVKINEKYVIIRFVAFKAFHDVGVKGFTLENKINLVNRLSKFARVFISSERELPLELKKYKFPLPPEKLHDTLNYASLYIGDSQTTSTEAACLGTPAIRCNAFAQSPQERANFIELERKYGLIYNYNVKNQLDAVKKALELIKQDNLRTEWKNRRKRMLSDNINVTDFLIWFIENYPESSMILRRNPDYQKKFK